MPPTKVPKKILCYGTGTETQVSYWPQQSTHTIYMKQIYQTNLNT